MDLSTIAALAGVVVAAAAVSVQVFALEPTRRSELLQFWLKWLTVGCLVVIAVNSIFGIYLFVQGPPQLVRSDIFTLALHLFNLLALPLIFFFEAMGKVMDARNAKRVELSETVEELVERVIKVEKARQPSEFSADSFPQRRLS